MLRAQVRCTPPRRNFLILKQFSGKLGQIMGWHSIPIRHTTRHLGNPESATELEQPRSDLFCLSFLHSTYVRLFNNLLMPGNSLDEQIYFLIQNEKLNRPLSTHCNILWAKITDNNWIKLLQKYILWLPSLINRFCFFFHANLPKKIIIPQI